jgi:hypothetical protein
MGFTKQCSNYIDITRVNFTLYHIFAYTRYSITIRNVVNYQKGKKKEKEKRP